MFKPLDLRSPPRSCLSSPCTAASPPSSHRERRRAARRRCMHACGSGACQELPPADGAACAPTALHHYKANPDSAEWTAKRDSYKAGQANPSIEAIKLSSKSATLNHFCRMYPRQEPVGPGFTGPVSPLLPPTLAYLCHKLTSPCHLLSSFVIF